MNEEIKSVLRSKGWQDILEVFNSEMDTNLQSIATTQTDREIATQYVGKIEAQNILRKVLLKLDQLSQEQEFKKQSFK